jgi:hypothetical protein
MLNPRHKLRLVRMALGHNVSARAAPALHAGGSGGASGAKINPKLPGFPQLSGVDGVSMATHDHLLATFWCVRRRRPTQGDATSSLGVRRAHARLTHTSRFGFGTAGARRGVRHRGIPGGGL